ncbi:RNA polymerase sigma factor [Bacillus spongiae]|uniref:RNA polymerase sigma factor n=1 Tax=Bacillus spongiae TaxID=2683610 RepID=A0ABU8HEZ1_9BACI
MRTDEELIKEIQSGDQASMEVLVERHYKTVYAFVYRRVGDKHTAYDLTQEVFIKMMKALPSFSFKATFPTWLLTIAVNHCRDYFRSKAYQQFTQTDEYEERLNVNRKEDVYATFEKNEKRQQMKELIYELPDYQSEAIILKYYHDLKISEIAKVTNTNASTVKSRLKQGLAKLKKTLEGSISFEG